MILKLRVGKWRLTLTVAPIADVVGVNSTLPDGNHILMWDFDCMKMNEVIQSLDIMQVLYQLPNIYILETRPDKCYIAYCFKRVPWCKAVEIVASTPGVCMAYFKYGVYREHFTLRVSPKCGRKPQYLLTLKSPYPEDVDIHELRSWVKYETLANGWKSRIYKLGVG